MVLSEFCFVDIFKPLLPPFQTHTDRGNRNAKNLRYDIIMQFLKVVEYDWFAIFYRELCETCFHFARDFKAVRVSVRGFFRGKLRKKGVKIKQLKWLSA